MPTLVSFTEITEGRGGGEDAAQNHEYKRVFVVELLPADSQCGSDAVKLVAPIPRILDVYTSAAGDYDAFSYCEKLDFSNLRAPWIWKVEASYSSDVDLSNPSGDPCLKPADISWGDKSAQKVLEVANDGTAITNSAGEVFNPPPMVEEHWQTITIEKNWADIDLVKLAAYYNTVNEKPWFGYATGEVKCVGISCKRQYWRGKFYAALTYNFEVKKKGLDSWAYQLLDIGFSQLVGGQIAKIRDKVGAPMPKGYLLNGAGVMLPRDPATGKLVPPNVPVYLTFYVYPSLDFNDLNVP